MLKRHFFISKTFLATYLGIHRDTLNEWLKKHEEETGKPLDLNDGKAVIDWIVEIKCHKEE